MPARWQGRGRSITLRIAPNRATNPTWSANSTAKARGSPSNHRRQTHSQGNCHMRKVLRGALAAGAVTLATVAGLAAAKADVIRIAIVVAGSDADYKNNVALLPTFEELLKKAGAPSRIPSLAS